MPHRITGIMNTKAAKKNGQDGPSSQSASNIAQRSRLKRTLLFAGVFALLAMTFVPEPMYDHGRAVGGGYRFIFDRSNTSVAFFQLVVNVAFAALLGAIIANLRVIAAAKRALRVIAAWKRVIATCIALALIGLGLFVVLHSAERAKADEENAKSVMQSFYDYDYVISKLRNAAFNWRLALQFEKAELAEARASKEAEKKEDVERRLAKQKEFDRQWRINADRVIAAHPELKYENSLYSLAMKKILNSNPLYSKRVDGYELAYEAIRKQLPPPGNLIPTSEFYRFLEAVKTDVAPAVPVAEQRNP